ncbi:tripartite tricarboxylate transporter substrate binding protein [soil metagenome]
MMNISKTALSASMQAIVLAGALACSALAQAQTYPTKPIRVVVPFNPGGSADLTARTVARKLQESMGQPVVVDNVGGAGGEIGVSNVVRSPADGYTILITPNGPITTAGLSKKLSYDVQNDLQPVGVVTLIPLLFAVNAALPVNTLPEFIAYAKKNPDSLNYSNPGPGSANQLNVELLRSAAGIKLTSVPYKGNGPAALAVATNEVQAGSGDFPSYFPVGPAGSGKVKFLASFTSKRTAALPNLPTVAESGLPDFAAVVSWIGMFVPARTPSAITTKLAAELSRIVNDPEVVATFARAGGEPAQMSPDEFGAYIKDQVVTLNARVKAANIQID